MLPTERNDCSLKRRRIVSIDPVSDEPCGKKRREDKDPDHWTPSARFWDTLLQIHLTHQALRELDRRGREQRAEGFGSQLSLSWRLNQDTKPGPALRRSTRLQRTAYPTFLRSVDSGRPDPCLQRFSRSGGPDLTDLRGFPDSTMSDRTSRLSKRTTSSGRTTSSRRSTPYDANYETKLAQAGVFLTAQRDGNNSRVMPTNYKEITTRLNETRASLSPSRFTEQDFERFQEQVERATTEASTMQRVISAIEGQDDRFHSLSDLPFNNIEPFNPDIAIAKPDHCDGAHPGTIDHRVLRDLNKHIVPSTNPSCPTAPNFFLEGKSGSGRADVAQRQAAYNGAVGARGMMSLQSYPARAAQYDNRASSFTNTYHDGTLKMYTTHATAPTSSGDQPQYHMTQLNSFAMTGNSKTFREGATYYRNARDLAKEQRDSFIEQANRAAQRGPTSKHSSRSATTVDTRSIVRTSSHHTGHESSPDTDTSADELALEKSLKSSRNTPRVHHGEDDPNRMSFTMSTLTSTRATSTSGSMSSSQMTLQKVRATTSSEARSPRVDRSRPGLQPTASRPAPPADNSSRQEGMGPLSESHHPSTRPRRRRTRKPAP